jgi:hypothetical protein
MPEIRNFAAMLASLPRTTAEQTITYNNNKDSSMRAPTCTIAAGLLAVAALSAARTVSAAYGAAYDTIYRIDLAKPAASTLGIAGRYGGQPIANLSGLTTQPDGSLLAIAGTLKAWCASTRTAASRRRSARWASTAAAASSTRSTSA